MVSAILVIALTICCDSSVTVDAQPAQLGNDMLALDRQVCFAIANRAVLCVYSRRWRMVLSRICGRIFG
jgi:hypothetical protein